MKTQIHISIPKPCSQNWQEMTLVEKGRFCDSCQKTVIDFSKHSDTAILKEIANNEHLCGRFMSNQLDRILVLRNEKSLVWKWGIASFLGFVGLGSQVSLGQEVVKKEVVKTSNISGTLNKSSEVKRTDIDFVVFCYDQKEKTNFLIRNINTGFMRTVENDETIKMSAAAGDHIFIDNENFVNDVFIIDQESIKNKFFTLGVNRYKIRSVTTGATLIGIKKSSFLQILIRPFRNLFKKKKCTTSLPK